MGLLHEFMKVDAPLRLERRIVEENIHEQGLAAPDRAPDIDALGTWLRLQKEPARPALLRKERGVQLIKALDRARLRRIAFERARADELLITR
jgi:hypothetical protein